MHKEEVQELLPEGASRSFSHKLRPCKPHRFNIRYSSRATILSASFPLFCLVCFHFLRVAVNARRPALFSNSSSPLSLSLSHSAGSVTGGQSERPEAVSHTGGGV